MGNNFWPLVWHSLHLLKCYLHLLPFHPASPASHKLPEILTGATHGLVTPSWLCVPLMALCQVGASWTWLHDLCVLWTPSYRGWAPSWLFVEVMHEDVWREVLRRQPSVRKQSRGSCEETDLMQTGLADPRNCAGHWPNGVVTDAGPQSLTQGIQSLLHRQFGSLAHDTGGKRVCQRLCLLTRELPSPRVKMIREKKAKSQESVSGKGGDSA